MLLPLGVPNRNGRVYTTEMMQGVIIANQERMERKLLVGELTDYDKMTPESYGHVNLTTASHFVTDMRIESGAAGTGWVICEIEFLDTQAGKMAKMMFDADQLDLVPRGSGNITDNIIVDYNLVSIDFIQKEEIR